MTKWLDGPAEDEDIVISTRIRVARNIIRYRFPSYLSIAESEELTDYVLDNVKDVLKENYKFVRIRDLSSRERMMCVEEHLISPSMIQNGDRSSFLVRDDERATIMINEEDHIRIQTLFPGLNLEEAWELCSYIDDELEGKLDYAYDERWGYLTSCPTNVGTGLRASVMLHLPCISITGNMDSVIEGLRKMGLTARGLYGEGSEALGYLYQISNQTTLGESEEEIIDKLNKVIYQIVGRERSIRKYLFESKRLYLEDKVFRSLGTLKYSRMMNSKESMNHLSNIRLGGSLGILDESVLDITTRLMIEVQPASIQNRFDRDMEDRERDIGRAQIMRDFIQSLEG